MYLTKEYLFAITDIDTQRNLQEFFGRTKITRIQRGANPKAKPDVQEVEIELIDDNVIKMLGVGHHITYMPKDKGTLYVGYTRYPHVPKTQEGYIRQGRDTENDFILFKQGILEPSTRTQAKKPVPPEVLYLAVEDKKVNHFLEIGLSVSSENYIQLHKKKEHLLNKKQKVTLEIDAKSFYQDGHFIYETDKNTYLIDELPAKYIRRRE